MVVRVDEVRDLVGQAVGGCDLIDSSLDVVADGRRRIKQHNTIWCRQECGLIGAVRKPVEIALDLPHVVTLLVKSRAECVAWDRRVIGEIFWVGWAGVRVPLGGGVGCANWIHLCRGCSPKIEVVGMVTILHGYGGSNAGGSAALQQLPPGDT